MDSPVARRISLAPGALGIPRFPRSPAITGSPGSPTGLGQSQCHPVQPLLVPQFHQIGEVPGRRADHAEAARAAALDNTAYEQEPGVEDGVGAGVVGVVEEGEVDKTGAVVQRAEDDPLAGADRRGLGGRLGARDQDRLAVPRLPQLYAP